MFVSSPLKPSARATTDKSQVELDSGAIPKKFSRSEADGSKYMQTSNKKKNMPPQSRRWSLMDGSSEDSLEGMCMEAMCFGG